MPIKLTKETRDHLIQSIKLFFRDQMELDIGDLKASIVLDFFIRQIAPGVYNQAVTDVQIYLQDKLKDVDSDLYLAESN